MGGEKYFPLLVELASDPACVKTATCMFLIYCQSVGAVLWRMKDKARDIFNTTLKVASNASDEVKAWVSFYQSIYERLVNPAKLSEDEATDLAIALLSHDYLLHNVEITGNEVDGYVEYRSVSQRDPQDYLYINLT